jgi:hypothetical protein
MLDINNTADDVEKKISEKEESNSYDANILLVKKAQGRRSMNEERYHTSQRI